MLAAGPADEYNFGLQVGITTRERRARVDGLNDNEIRKRVSCRNAVVEEYTQAEFSVFS